MASCLRGALPPVDLRAVCLVRAIFAYDCETHAQGQHERVGVALRDLVDQTSDKKSNRRKGRVYAQLGVSRRAKGQASRSRCERQHAAPIVGANLL